MNDQEVLQSQQEIDAHLRGGRYAEAVAVCEQLRAKPALSPSVFLMISQVFQRVGDFPAMLDAARAAAALQPGHVGTRLRVVESQIYCGQIGAALAELGVLEGDLANDAPRLQDVAQMYLHCAGHIQAGRCYERALQLRPNHPSFLYNLASSCVAVGEIDRAEQLFNQVIALDPADVGAYLNRSMLRTWKKDNHHIDQLLKVLRLLPEGHAGEVPVCYALAKEYEDLGEAEKSFSALVRGASARRKMLAYQVDKDVAAMRQIATTFDASLLATATSAVTEEGAILSLVCRAAARRWWIVF